MKTAVFALIFVLNSSTFAQTNPTCQPDSVLPRIYGSVSRYLCMNLFYGGASNGEQKEAAVKCGEFLAKAGVATVTGGLVAGTVHHQMEKNKTIADIKKEKKRLMTDMRAWNRTELKHEGQSIMRFVKGEELKRISQEQHNLTKLLLQVNSSYALSKTSTKLIQRGIIAGASLAAMGVLTAATTILDASPAGCGELIHMYTDTEDNCSYKPEIGPNTARYLGLPLEEQKKIMSDLPGMCEQYNVLAEKLESDLNKAFPLPEFQVTACGKNNEVTGVDLKYDAETFSLKKNGNTLSAQTGATQTVNYELLLKDKGFGVDSVESVRAAMKTSKVTRVHMPSEVLNNTSRSNATAQRELASSLKALHGFTTVKDAVGNECQKYLEQQGPEADATTPTAR